MTAKKADPTSEEALIQSWLSAKAGVSIRKVWPGENLDAAFEGFSRDALRHARVNPPESVRAVEKVTASDRKNLGPANRIKLVRLYAHALSHAGQLKASDRHYRRAWDLSVKLNLREQIVFTGLGWTNILSLLGHYEEAKRIGHYAMSRLKNSERVLKARLSNNLGVVYHRWGKFEQAVTLLKESRRQLKALGFRYDFAYVTYTLGHSLLLQGEDLRFARKCIEEGRAYFAENKLHTLDLYARTALALADLSDGHYRKAMETLEELHDDLEKLGDKRATALILRQQAEFLGAVGALDKAEVLARKAYDTYRELGMVGDVATTAHFHARILRRLGRYLDARVRLEESLQHWVQTKNKRAQHRVEVELAATLMDRRAFSEAKAILRRVVPVLTKQEPHRSAIRGRHLLALNFFSDGQMVVAKRHALQAYEDATEYPYKLDRPWIALTLAKIFKKQGETKDAVTWARRCLVGLENQALRLGSNVMREQVSAAQERLYGEAIQIVLESDATKGPERAVDLLSRSRAPQLIEDLHWKGSGIDTRLRLSIGRLRQELMGFLDTKGEEHIVPTLQKRMKSLDRSLAQRKTAPTQVSRKALESTRFSEWKKRVGNRTLVIYDKSLGDWSAFVVRPQGPVEHVWLPGAREALRGTWWGLRLIFEQAASLDKDRREDFLEQTQTEALTALESLRDELLQPLKLDTSESVVFVPDGELHEVPLEALALISEGSSSGLVASRWPHPAVMQKKKTSASPAAILLHNGSPGTRREARDIGSLLRRRGFKTRVSSRIEAFDKSATRYGVVHAASHGNYHRDRWLLNGIQLANGWLGFEHLRPANLKGSLMYFGSCESGLQNEASGLSLNGWLSAGLGAGAAELMLALWKIDDQSASVYAKNFYPSWCEGSGSAVAAKTAREHVRALHPHPFSWAPFLVVG